MSTNIFPIHLTKSRVRRDLLTLFFLNPHQAYYVRELERRLNFSVGTLARELKSLSGGGLLAREARGREVFYRLNKAYPLFHEVKGIIEKTTGMTQRLSEGLKKQKTINKAYLYGSFAKGKMGPESDIDLLLVGKETDEVRALIRQLEKRFGRTINTTTYSLDEFNDKKQNKAEFLYTVMKNNPIVVKF